MSRLALPGVQGNVSKNIGFHLKVCEKVNTKDKEGGSSLGDTGSE
jgi:hypothetical protein